MYCILEILQFLLHVVKCSFERCVWGFFFIGGGGDINQKDFSQNDFAYLNVSIIKINEITSTYRHIGALRKLYLIKVLKY